MQARDAAGRLDDFNYTFEGTEIVGGAPISLRTEVKASLEVYNLKHPLFAAIFLMTDHADLVQENDTVLLVLRG